MGLWRSWTEKVKRRCLESDNTKIVNEAVRAMVESSELMHTIQGLSEIQV